MTNTPEGLLRGHKDGVLLNVRVTPKSSCNRVDGICRTDDGAVSLMVRVSAQPERGKANKAVIETLAKKFNCAKSKLSIASGNSSRNKTILFRAESNEVEKALEKLQ